MTIVFVDAGNPMDPLADRDAPAIVQADALAFGTISFPDAVPPRVEEAAYRDGAFVGPYAALSTRTGSGPYIYNFRRNGGWPSRPRPHVEEQVTAPVGGQAWGGIYAVDLTAQATQTISGAGSHTIDGLTWWSKGGSPFNSGNFNELINGSGLRPAAAAFAHSGNYPYQSLWFPFLQLPLFNIDAPYAVAMRWSGSLDSSHYVVGGLSSLPDNASNVLTGDRGCQNLISYDGSTPTHITQGALDNTNMGSSLGAVSGHVFYTAALSARVASTGRRTFSGAPLDPDVQNLPSSGVNNFVITPATNPGFWLTCNNTDTVAYLTHLAVFQPKVAA